MRQPIKVSNNSVSDVDEHSPTGSESVTIQLVVNENAETLFKSICPTHPFLTDDVVNNQSFMACVESSQSPIMYYLKLQHQYCN